MTDKQTAFEEILSFLEKITSSANSVLMDYFGRDLSTSVKEDDSIVTEADLKSEQIILSAIRKVWPNDVIYSEESGLSSDIRVPGKNIWIIDPLDGTTNFANGYPFFAVSIGYGRFLESGRVQMEAAAIGEPAAGKVYLAARGLGATCGEAKLRVKKVRPFRESFLVTGFYYNKGEDLVDDINRFAKVAEECLSIRRDGAAALDLAYVANGIYDGFWEKGLQPWDVAAGSLLVSEAGGTVINYAEQPYYDIEDAGIIAGTTEAVNSLARLVVRR